MFSPVKYVPKWDWLVYPVNTVFLRHLIFVIFVDRLEPWKSKLLYTMPSLVPRPWYEMRLCLFTFGTWLVKINITKMAVYRYFKVSVNEASRSLRSTFLWVPVQLPTVANGHGQLESSIHKLYFNENWQMAYPQKFCPSKILCYPVLRTKWLFYAN